MTSIDDSDRVEVVSPQTIVVLGQVCHQFSAHRYMVWPVGHPEKARTKVIGRALGQIERQIACQAEKRWSFIAPLDLAMLFFKGIVTEDHLCLLEKLSQTCLAIPIPLLNGRRMLVIYKPIAIHINFKKG